MEGVRNYATQFPRCLDRLQVAQVLFRFPAMEASTPYLMRRGGAHRASTSLTVRPSHLSREWESAPRGGVLPRRGRSVDIVFPRPSRVVQVHQERPATEASPLYLTRRGGREHASINHSTRSPPLVQLATSPAVEDWPLHLRREGECVSQGVEKYATLFFPRPSSSPSRAGPI